MHLIQLLLPLYDNNKQPFRRKELDHVRDELTERFGGVTAFLQSPAEGVWREGADHVSRDQVVNFEVMTEHLDREWWAGYRETLEERFRQDQIIIRATSIEQL